MHQNTSHRDPSMDTDYRPTRYGSTDTDRVNSDESRPEKLNLRHSTTKHESPYKNLISMGVLHVPIMYLIMFSMVDTRNDIYQNLNTFYMALMMAAPMVAVMPFMMKKMYSDTRKNLLVALGSTLVLAGAFFAIRYQTAVGDTQFIRSMVPHHSGAILMCREANLKDLELKDLCDKISAGQRLEIEQMNKILKRL